MVTHRTFAGETVAKIRAQKFMHGVSIRNIKRAEALFEKTERDAMERRQNYVRLQKSFDMEIKERKEKEAAEKAEK